MLEDVSQKQHVALVSMHIEIYDILPTGECSGHPIKASEMKEHNIKSKILCTIKGNNKEDCIKKLQKRIKLFNKE